MPLPVALLGVPWCYMCSVLDYPLINSHVCSQPACINWSICQHHEQATENKYLHPACLSLCEANLDLGAPGACASQTLQAEQNQPS